MVSAQAGIRQREWHAKNSQRFWDTNDHLILARRSHLVVINMKINGHLVNFAVPVDHRGEIKVSEKIDKYLDLARELKRTGQYVGDGDINCHWCAWNGPQRLVKNLRNWKSEEESKPSRPRHGWNWLGYWEKSWRTEETCWHSESSDIPTVKTIGRNSVGKSSCRKTRL